MCLYIYETLTPPFHLTHSYHTHTPVQTQALLEERKEKGKDVRYVGRGVHASMDSISPPDQGGDMY